MPGQISPNQARNDEMADLFRKGSTLQEIGDQYGITRERVRQLIKRSGLTWEDGGAHAKALVKVRYAVKGAKDNSKCQIVYGCSREEVAVLNDGLPRHAPGCRARKYMQQRRNAVKRGIAWEITFKQWVGAWEASGKYAERGRGKGYCMARIGDTGGYRPDNVEIITVGQNFSDSHLSKPRTPTKGTWKTHCKYGHLRTPETVGAGRHCLVCGRERSAARRAQKNDRLRGAAALQFNSMEAK